MSSFLTSIIMNNSNGAKKPFYIFGNPDDVHNMIHNALEETPFILNESSNTHSYGQKNVVFLSAPEDILVGSLVIRAFNQSAPIFLIALHSPEETYPKKVAQDILKNCLVFLCEKDILVRYN